MKNGMRNDLYINEQNENDEKVVNITDLIEKLLTTKNIIKLKEEELIILEEKIAETGYDAIGIKKDNLRISITPKKEEQVINYKQTLIDNEVEEDITYFETKDIITSKTNIIYNEELIKEKFKDNLSYDPKTKKAVIGIRELKKDK